MSPWIEHVKPRVSDPRTRRQPSAGSVVQQVLNPVAPLVKWETETRGSLEAHGPASFLYTIENDSYPSKEVAGRTIT